MADVKFVIYDKSVETIEDTYESSILSICNTFKEAKEELKDYGGGTIVKYNVVENELIFVKFCY